MSDAAMTLDARTVELFRPDSDIWNLGSDGDPVRYLRRNFCYRHSGQVLSQCRPEPD